VTLFDVGAYESTGVDEEKWRRLSALGPDTGWTPPDLGSLPSWKGCKRVGIDTEFWDPTLDALGPGVRRESARLAGVSFALCDGPSHYLPFGHFGGGNLDRDRCLEYLRDQAREFRGTVEGFSLSGDLDWLAEDGVHFPRAEKFLCAQVGDAVTYELHHRYTMNAVAHRRGERTKDERELDAALARLGLKDHGGIALLHSRFVGAYGEYDARLPLKLNESIRREVEQKELSRVYELECDLLPVLVKMTRRGVRVAGEERFQELERWALREEAIQLSTIKRLTGVAIAVAKVGAGDSVWSASACAKALLQAGVTVGSTPTGLPSVTDELLRKYADFEVATAILRARKVSKFRTTFLAALRKYEVNGRIHCTFNQVRRERGGVKGGIRGARSGRLSAEDPNMTQMIGDRYPELKKKLRGAFLPDEGCVFACPDFGKQEPKMALHFAVEAGVPGAAEWAEQYNSNPIDFHQMVADLVVAQTGRPFRRRIAKDVFLGMGLYGMGGAKLCRFHLNLPTRTNDRGYEVAGPEGQAIIDAVHAAVPWARKIASLAQWAAAVRGYVKTVLGRRINFPRGGGAVWIKHLRKEVETEFDWTNKALNNVVQGSAADQFKLSMVRADAAGIPLQLPEHDELVMSVPRDDPQIAQLRGIMLEAVTLRVFTEVDVEVGEDWGSTVECEQVGGAWVPKKEKK